MHDIRPLNAISVEFVKEIGKGWRQPTLGRDRRIKCSSKYPLNDDPQSWPLEAERETLIAAGKT
jgi:hypothetical protein